jgi:hypothetical protein
MELVQWSGLGRIWSEILVRLSGNLLVPTGPLTPLLLSSQPTVILRGFLPHDFWAMVSLYILSSVADPDPDPPDPYVFGLPGSRSRSGSGSFYHQAKPVRKTLIPLFCDFFLTFYL